MLTKSQLHQAGEDKKTSAIKLNLLGPTWKPDHTADDESLTRSPLFFFFVHYDLSSFVSP